MDNLAIFQTVLSARATYGLRQQDFVRYHSHCAAKVRHLRKAANLVQGTARGKKFTNKPISKENATSNKHMLILLFDAERAWAYSQHLITSLNNPDHPPSARHHGIQRLSRAVKHATQLHNLISSEAPILDRAQAAAYRLVMEGTLSFAQERHEAGVKQLSVAKSLLEAIASNSSTAHEEALANEIVDQVEPMLRFCAYNLELDTSSGTAPIAASITEKHRTSQLENYDSLMKELQEYGGRFKRGTVELTWRDKTIPIRNAQLVTIVLKAQTAMKGLVADSKTRQVKKKNRELADARRMGSFDRVLLVLAEGEEIARELVRDKLAISTSAASEPSTIALQDAHSYLIYHLLAVRTQRDLFLINDTKSKLAAREAKLRTTESKFISQNGSFDPTVCEAKVKKQRARVYPALVKVYDTVIMNLEQMRDLETVEKDVDLSASIEARIAFVKASRSLFMSRSFALINQFSSALSLNVRAKLYVRETESFPVEREHESEDFDFVSSVLPMDTNSIEDIQLELDKDYMSIGAEWYTATDGKPQMQPEDLNIEGIQFDDTKTKEKETFYDVAFNYVVDFPMDDIADKAGLEKPSIVQEEIKKEEPVAVPKKSGWGFGLFGR